jgi:glucose-6-phosphate 1-epimerase
LDQQCYIDCLDEWHEKTQQGPIIINQEIDRIYRTGSTIKINEGDTRSIALQSQGSNSTVVWNPWVEKAKRLSHFADQAYREMLCIETANAEQDSVSLEPGQQHHLSLTISSNA